MKRPPHAGRARLVDPAPELVAVRTLASLGEVRAALELPGDWWGYIAQPDEIRLLHQPGEVWRRDLADPELVPDPIELRLFRPEADLRWLADAPGGRGVLLETLVGDGSEADLPPATTRIGGSSWAARDRRSRLWGEYLEGSDTWYEEAIPDPVHYPAIPPGPENRNVFLCYREYVHEGVVRFVRYIRLEGSRR